MAMAPCLDCDLPLALAHAFTRKEKMEGMFLPGFAPIRILRVEKKGRKARRARKSWLPHFGNAAILNPVVIVWLSH
jgi:hypothetical protein